MNDKYLQLSSLPLHPPESEPSCILVGNANQTAIPSQWWTNCPTALGFTYFMFVRLLQRFLYSSFTSFALTLTGRYFYGPSGWVVSVSVTDPRALPDTKSWRTLSLIWEVRCADKNPLHAGIACLTLFNIKAWNIMFNWTSYRYWYLKSMYKYILWLHTFKTARTWSSECSLSDKINTQ